MKEPSARHYSYTVYADPATAGSFDERRFGGPIGQLIASGQADLLKQFIGDARGLRVLDVGTGTGRAALLLAAQGAQVTGIDASEEMLAVARRRAAEQGVSATFQRGDAHRLDFADQSFDAVVSLRVLMHTPQWQSVLAELCRVAGRLVIVDYPSASSFAALQSAARRLTFAVGMRTEPYRVFTGAAIERAFLRNGFRIRTSDHQFVLPIALHKMIGSRAFTTSLERALDRVGLTKRFGSPVTIAAERCAAS